MQRGQEKQLNGLGLKGAAVNLRYLVVSSAAAAIFAGAVSAASARTFILADSACTYPDVTATDVTADKKLGDALDAHDSTKTAYWGEIHLREQLNEVQSVPSAHCRALNYASVLNSGSEIVFELIAASEDAKALKYARKLAQIWQRYHRDPGVLADSDAKASYEGFPDEITHALHYQCEPAAPDGKCPWPVPASIAKSTMQQ